MLEKILVPTDGSYPSDRALRYAVDLAQISKKSQIILLHVLKEWWLPLGFTGNTEFISPITGKKIKEKQYTTEIIQLLETKATKSLKNQIKPYYKSSVVIKTVVLIGDPSNKITEFARKEKINLIIMGITYRKGIIAKIGAIGSTSRRVL
ncbi:MAG TPA: universal stress protein, partial [Candidatus Nitrosotalea sp.]|nr:universal stress protein [Candidatus Nitrosotalea sp.]